MLNDLTPKDLCMPCKDTHVLNFYEQPNAKRWSVMVLFHILLSPPFFTIKDVCIGLRKLASQKASDLQCINIEMLKWMGKRALAWTNDMFNHAS